LAVKILKNPQRLRCDYLSAIIVWNFNRLKYKPSKEFLNSGNIPIFKASFIMDTIKIFV